MSAAAAAAIARKLREEEEEMTPYQSQDLSQDWEFKILRSATGAFRDPDKLRRILEEEGRAGWSLVEKFDNRRIRLKRPASARTSGGGLDFDPYRTWVGVSDTKLAMIIVACMVAGALVAALIINFGYLVVRRS